MPTGRKLKSIYRPVGHMPTVLIWIQTFIITWESKMAKGKELTKRKF